MRHAEEVANAAALAKHDAKGCTSGLAWRTAEPAPRASAAPPTHAPAPTPPQDSLRPWLPARSPADPQAAAQPH